MVMTAIGTAMPSAAWVARCQRGPRLGARANRLILLLSRGAEDPQDAAEPFRCLRSADGRQRARRYDGRRDRTSPRNRRTPLADDPAADRVGGAGGTRIRAVRGVRRVDRRPL